MLHGTADDAVAAAVATFYSSFRPEQSRLHSSQGQARSQRSDAEMQKKNICVRQSSVQIWNAIQGKGK